MQINLTNQEIFNKVATHLFTQGKRSFDKKLKVCAYRNDEGLSCAIGCLIPDELYDPAFEGRRIWGLMDENYEVKKYFSNVSLELLSKLQGVHDYKDSWTSSGTLRSFLHGVAKDFELDYSILDNLRFEGR